MEPTAHEWRKPSKTPGLPQRFRELVPSTQHVRCGPPFLCNAHCSSTLVRQDRFGVFSISQRTDLKNLMKKKEFNFSINVLKLLIASEISTHLTDLKGLTGM